MKHLVTFVLDFSKNPKLVTHGLPRAETLGRCDLRATHGPDVDVHVARDPSGEEHGRDRQKGEQQDSGIRPCAHVTGAQPETERVAAQGNWSESSFVSSFDSFGIFHCTSFDQT